ncbi:MAG: hypothetical protein Fur0020_01990 [Thermodesulfovibrionia bacterium]
MTLALLYSLEHKDNPFYNNQEILNYINAGLEFWCRMQESNGSFNEWYHHENSFVATAFSSYAVSETILLLGEKLRADVNTRAIHSLKKAGSWLAGRQETRVMNQQAGAVIALYNIYQLTGDRHYLDAVNEKIGILKQKQSIEGWFIEYGGPDIGYLSLAIDYLCKYYKKTHDRVAEEMISRALSFIKYFIQPNFVAGGEYASRNTEYLIPHGFEFFSRYNKDAGFIASVIRRSLENTNSFPSLFDDRYLTYVGYTWLQAYIDANPEIDEDELIKEIFDNEFRRHFTESGLLVINDHKRHLIVNMNKGGAFRLFDKTCQHIHIDAGIMVESEEKYYTSGWLSDTEKTYNDNTIIIEGNMFRVSDKRLTPLITIFMRIFQLVFGRVSMISLWIKERLRDLLITKTKESDIRYRREIRLDSGHNVLLRIRDHIFCDKRSISEIAVYTKDTHIYVPSSRYYVTMRGVPAIIKLQDVSGECVIEWEIRAGMGGPVIVG